MTGRELLDAHVDRFNAGVRSGDFRPMLDGFTDDATLEFVGVPVGPFRGRDAIQVAYLTQPPDDEIDVLEAWQREDLVCALYAWRRDEGRAAGEMWIARDGDRIAKLVVTFGATP